MSSNRFVTVRLDLTREEAMRLLGALTTMTPPPATSEEFVKNRYLLLLRGEICLQIAKQSVIMSSRRSS